MSLATNGLLMLAIAFLWLREHSLPLLRQTDLTLPSVQLLLAQMPPPEESPEELGERHQLSYQQWVDLLAKEANFVAEAKPEHLYILLGDSISLWFPPEMLPPNKHWLNQGISGERSQGLLQRLDVLDSTNPKAIFLMIGINDLLHGVSDQTLLANQRLIIQDLRRVHPEAKIVVQSILPHSGEKATWEGRDRLLKIPPERIQRLNKRLEAIATEEDALYLDLYTLFADEQGDLKSSFSTDGLHLSPEGYKLWSIALEICTQLLVESKLDSSR
ncbi:MAG: SGNH/GDSL hydrolase family protein [Chroococcales cyanobacterium]